MIRPTRTVLAVSALGLALGAGACQDGGTETSQAPQSASPQASATGQPWPPQPTGAPNPSDDLYTGAAARFTMSKAAIEQAAVAAKLEMLKLGGPEGEKLPNGALDPAVLEVFAKTLAVPVNQAEPVLRYLVAEWDEYNQQSDAKVVENINKYFASELKISARRAEWLRGLLLQRPHVAEGQPDPVFDAVARDLGVTVQRLTEVADGSKKNSSGLS
jgi:hypothetical protein